MLSTLRFRVQVCRCLPLLAALAGLAFSACSNSAPEILGVEARIEKRPAGKGTDSIESLSVFANIKDADGLEDIEAIWLIDDKEELSWLIDERNWTAMNISGETWLGAADVHMLSNGSFPRGGYRLIVANFAGQRTEFSFKLLDPPAALGKKSAPSMTSTGKDRQFTVSSSWPSTYLLAYDAGGLLITAKEVKPGLVSPETLLGRKNLERTEYLELYGYDPPAKFGAYSWRTRIK